MSKKSTEVEEKGILYFYPNISDFIISYVQQKSRVTIYHSNRDILRAKGSAVNNYTGTTGMNWASPR